MGNEDTWGKTKAMMVSKQGEDCKVCVDGEEIEQVQNMKTLGTILSADGTCEEEIERRVGAVARVIGAMRKEVLERRELKKATKMRVYNAMVIPTMLQTTFQINIKFKELMQCNSSY